MLFFFQLEYESIGTWCNFYNKVFNNVQFYQRTNSYKPRFSDSKYNNESYNGVQILWAFFQAFLLIPYLGKIFIRFGFSYFSRKNLNVICNYPHGKTPVFRATVDFGSGRSTNLVPTKYPPSGHSHGMYYKGEGQNRHIFIPQTG